MVSFPNAASPIGNKDCTKDGCCGTLNSKGSNRMSSPAALPNTDRALSAGPALHRPVQARAGMPSRSPVPPIRAKRREIVPQRVETTRFEPGNGMAFGRNEPQDVVRGGPSGEEGISPRRPGGRRPRRCVAGCEGTDFGACPSKTAASRRLLGPGCRSVETGVVDAAQRRSRRENRPLRRDGKGAASSWKDQFRRCKRRDRRRRAVRPAPSPTARPPRPGTPAALLCAAFPRLPDGRGNNSRTAF